MWNTDRCALAKSRYADHTWANDLSAIRLACRILSEEKYQNGDMRRSDLSTKQPAQADKMTAQVVLCCAEWCIDMPTTSAGSRDV